MGGNGTVSPTGRLKVKRIRPFKNRIRLFKEAVKRILTRRTTNHEL